MYGRLSLRLFAILITVDAFLNNHLSKAAELNEFIRHYESLHLRANFTTETSESVTSKFQFKTHGRDFNIHLETNSRLFHPDFKLKVVGKGGTVVTETVDTRRIVIGYVEGDEYSLVHGHLREGTRFDGIIHTTEETYHVEPLEKYRHLTQRDTDHNTVIYKVSDVQYDLDHTRCSSTDSPNLRRIQESGGHSYRASHSNILRKKREVDPNKNTCTVKVVADNRFFSSIGEGQKSTTLEVMALHIADADQIYRTTDFEGSGGTFRGFGLAILEAQVFDNQYYDPLSGEEYSVDGLLEAFSEQEFDHVCLGHLFTYRDFEGTIGLAYLGDPNGQLAGGICQQRTRTNMGNLNLNTGFTSFLNFGQEFPRAVSLITTAHELGHNHGSPHDQSDDCTPGGSQGNYIMFASATDGRLPNNRLFSPCSEESIGLTIQNRGSCFIPRPRDQVCGNGVVEGDEECDCGSENEDVCNDVDPCCKPGNCTLKAGKQCSGEKYPCCNGTTCEYNSFAGVLCLKGDGQCQEDSHCDGSSPACPPAPTTPDNTPCDYDQERKLYNNVCDHGICNGSICIAYNSTECYCSNNDELCQVCCIFDGECISTFSDKLVNVNGTYVRPGYPCRNFTGYCKDDQECIFIDNNTPLDNLKDIFLNLSFTSIVGWIEDNWYWVLAGFAGLIILIILLQVTYRRKKPKEERGAGRSYGFYQTPDQDAVEASTLLDHNGEETRT